MKYLKYVLVSVILIAMNSTYGQYTGKGSMANKEISTVQQVKDNAGNLDRKDVIVKLKGFIIEQINSETFWFEDHSGKIKVEIDKKAMPKEEFNETTELIISAEVDSDLLEGVELEIEKIEFVTPKKLDDK